MNWILLKILQALVVGIGVAILAATARRNARVSVVGRVVEYGWPWKVFSVFSLIVLMLMIADYLSGDPKATIQDWRVPAFFGLMVTPLGLHIFVRKVIFYDGGFTTVSPWSKTKEVKWGEVKAIEYLSSWNHYRIQTAAGTICYLDELMSGKTEFLKFAKKRRITVRDREDETKDHR